MGVISFFSSSSGDDKYDGIKHFQDDLTKVYPPEEKIIRVNSTPNPKHFEIINYRMVGKYLVLKVRYPDCTNYEGVKIMVYEDTNIIEIQKVNKGAIDPHFGVNPDFISPIARFEPTDRGWEMAIKFCKSMDI